MADLPSPQTSALAPNLAGALAYLLGPITGIAFLLLERQSRFVRFHAAQSILVGGVVIVASIALTVVSSIVAVVPIVGWLVSLLISLVLMVGIFVLWVTLMLRAFRGDEWEVPVLGAQARRLITAPAID